MKAKLLFPALVVALTLAGCGKMAEWAAAPEVMDIQSEGTIYDGGITRSSAGVYSVKTSDQSPFTVLVNSDATSETRGFITFSLGAVESIPDYEPIQRATVYLPVRAVRPIGYAATVHVSADIVSVPALNTLTTPAAMDNAFNAPQILPMASFDVRAVDLGDYCTFDVTDLVIEARNSPPAGTVQFRLISTGGAVEFDEDLFAPTGEGVPLIRVEYGP